MTASHRRVRRAKKRAGRRSSKINHLFNTEQPRRALGLLLGRGLFLGSRLLLGDGLLLGSRLLLGGGGLLGGLLLRARRLLGRGLLGHLWTAADLCECNTPGSSGVGSCAEKGGAMRAREHE